MNKVVIAILTAAAANLPVLHPPENLVTVGVPDPPLTLVEDLDCYTQARSAVLEDWHPNDRKMLIQTRFGETNQIHQVDLPGGARRQLTFFRDSARDASYSPETPNYFVFSKDSGGDEFYQKYCFDTESKAVTLLTDGKSRNTGGVWSNRGDLFAYGSTRRNGRDVDVYLLNPTKEHSDHLAVELKGGGWMVLDWSPDDEQILLKQEISATESYLWLADSKHGGKRMLTAKSAQGQVSYGTAIFTRDGKGLYLTSDQGAEFKRLAYHDLETGKEEYLTETIPWDIEDLAISWDGKTLAYTANEDGIAKLYVMDVVTRKVATPTNIPSGQIRSLLFHRNNVDLGFSIENSQSPGDVYSYNVQTGQLDRWTYSETGSVDTRNFSEPKLAHFKTFDGKQLSAFVYEPPARFTGKRPVIIAIHGGPEAQWRPRFLGRNSYLINELGITMIYPNVRGSTGYGKSFTSLDNGFLREDAYKDIGALLDWVKTQPRMNAERVMLTGGSYGGHMTLACAERYNERICCAIDIVGPSNLATFLKTTQEYRRDLRRVEYGDEREPHTLAFLEKIAPSNNAAQIKKPLFVVQGLNDPRVPVSEAEQMVKSVTSSGVPVWYLLAKDEGHGFAKKANNDFLFYATVQFIKKFLLI